jgi:hypothetical protein
VELSEVWTYIADTSCRDYSPLYDRICRTVAASDEVLDLVREAPRHPGHHPILLLAAVHYLVLGGIDHELADVYAGRSDADPGPLFVDLCRRRRTELIELLTTRRVNTNEVGRSAVLAPALTTIAARHGAPLAHLDVGCSAGLNLLADRYRLDYGDHGATGPADAPVRVDCEVVGGAPPIAATLPAVAARVGLDQAPVDVHDDDLVRWQLACVWPDTGRLPRTRAALAEARSTPLTLVQGDAVEVVAEAVAKLPADATAVVSTTWVLAYLPRPQRTAFADALAEASRDRPVLWISAEGYGVTDAIPGDRPPASGDDSGGVEPSVLGLVTFTGGRSEPELLAYVHPHGSTLDWRAPASS